MGTTNGLLLRYPELTDTADGPDAFSKLANDVEDYFFDRILPSGVARYPGYAWGSGTSYPNAARAGDTIIRSDLANATMICTAAGTPGTWRQMVMAEVANDAALRALTTANIPRGFRVIDLATSRIWEWNTVFWRLLNDLPRMSGLVSADSLIGSGGWSSIGHSIRVHDNWSALGVSTGGLYTIPVQGIYQINFLGVFDLTAAATVRGVRLQYAPLGVPANLTSVQGSASVMPGTANTNTAMTTPTVTREFVVSDVIYPQMFQNSGGNINIKGQSGNGNSDQITALRIQLIDQTG